MSGQFHSGNVVASNFRAVPRNTLKGFFDVSLIDVGLCIADVAWHEQNGRQWVALPARPIVDTKTGVAERDPRTGKIRYQPMMRFARQEVSDAFQRAAVSAIDTLASAAMKDGSHDNLL